jgi:hypothetical protein
VEALGQVPVLVHSHPQPAQLRDISATGFAIETQEPVKVGRSYEFELQFPHSPIHVAATCVRCGPIGTADKSGFLAGFAINGVGGRARRVVADFIAKRTNQQLVER